MPNQDEVRQALLDRIYYNVEAMERHNSSPGPEAETLRVLAEAWVSLHYPAPKQPGIV